MPGAGYWTKRLERRTTADENFSESDSLRMDTSTIVRKIPSLERAVREPDRRHRPASADRQTIIAPLKRSLFLRRPPSLVHPQRALALAPYQPLRRPFLPLRPSIRRHQKRRSLPTDHSLPSALPITARPDAPRRHIWRTLGRSRQSLDDGAKRPPRRSDSVIDRTKDEWTMWTCMRRRGPLGNELRRRVSERDLLCRLLLIKLLLRVSFLITATLLLSDSN